MFYVVFCPFLVAFAAYAIPVAGRLISSRNRDLGPAPDEAEHGPVKGEDLPRRTRCPGPPSPGGPTWGKVPPGRIRIDGAGGKRHRPVRLRLRSR
jgi:hypothetical protein